MMGYKPHALLSLISDSSIPAVEACLKSLVAIQDKALAAHKLAHHVMSSCNNQGFTLFAKGDKVWLEARNLKQSIANLKFTPKQEGPFIIVKVLFSITYQLCLLKVWKIHHTLYASLLMPYCENPIHSPNFPTPLPNLIESEEEYEIKKTLCHCDALTVYMYLIQWKGYSAKEDSWIAKWELKHAKSTLDDYTMAQKTVCMFACFTLIMMKCNNP